MGGAEKIARGVRFRPWRTLFLNPELTRKVARKAFQLGGARVSNYMGIHSLVGGYDNIGPVPGEWWPD